MRLAGVEPAHTAPEAVALSIGPQAHVSTIFYQEKHATLSRATFVLFQVARDRRKLEQTQLLLLLGSCVILSKNLYFPVLLIKPGGNVNLAFTNPDNPFNNFR